ncbi:DUF397 domain-containing protein [Streptomyces sp. NBC_00081]
MPRRRPARGRRRWLEVRTEADCDHVRRPTPRARAVRDSKNSGGPASPTTWSAFVAYGARRQRHPRDPTAPSGSYSALNPAAVADASFPRYPLGSGVRTTTARQ